MHCARALAAGVAAAALMLAGCSSPSSSPRAEESLSPLPATTPSEPKHSATSTPSERPSPTASRSGDPRFPFPKDTKLVFKYGTTGDPKKDAVLKDLQTFWTAWYYARLDPREPRLKWKRYARGQAERFLSDVLARDRQQGRGSVGVKSLYRPTVSVDGRDAMVVECSDETKFFFRDLKSGSVFNEKPGQIWYETREALRRRTTGQWIVTTFTFEEGQPRCKP